MLKYKETSSIVIYAYIINTYFLLSSVRTDLASSPVSSSKSLPSLHI